jgi:hypothetical protein
MKTQLKNRRTKKSDFKLINEDINKNKINREIFCGSIQLKIEPINYQRKMRNEWK